MTRRSGSSVSFVTVRDFNPDLYNASGTECVGAATVAGLMTGTAWVSASSTFDVVAGPDQSGMSAVSFVTVSRWNLEEPSSAGFYGGLSLSAVEEEGLGTLAMPWTSGGDMVAGPEYVNARGGRLVRRLRRICG